MKRLLSLCLLLTLVVSFSACGENSYQSGSDGEFRVITSFYPVYVVALNLIDGAENVSLANLTKTDYGCMHDYALTTNDMKKLSAADLFIASGMDMEAFVGKNILGLPNLEVLDSGEDIPKTLKGEGGNNSHYWMNIENAISQCDKIARTLIRLNPENSEIYEKNAAEYKEKLTQLLSESSERCEKINKRDMIVFDESFDYFADEFGFNVIKLLSGHGGSSASPKQIAEVVEHMEKDNIDAVYVSEGDSQSAAMKAVKRETGCKVFVLDTLTGGKLDDNTKNAYIDAVRHNLEVLEESMTR